LKDFGSEIIESIIQKSLKDSPNPTNLPNSPHSPNSPNNNLNNSEKGDIGGMGESKGQVDTIIE
jgi:hypothetical protein